VNITNQRQEIQGNADFIKGPKRNKGVREERKTGVKEKGQ